VTATRRLLAGGMVADGVGHTVSKANVLIEDDVIAAVGPRVDAGIDAQVIELALGSVVCPGFIDAHVHAEGPLAEDGQVAAALAQGVTTLVVGQDGSSWIGATEATAAYLSAYFGPVNGPAPPGGCDLAGFAALVRGRLRQNVAVLASQGTIRHNIAGTSAQPLDAAETKAARVEVERSLEQGAVGLSSGLDYVPSRFAAPDELATMCAPLADTGRPYVSHLRAYGAGVRDGLAELASVGRRSGARVHASHLWGAPAAIAAGLAAAETSGVEISFDMYPYTRSSTILPMLLLPPQVMEGGTSAALGRLADPATRAGLLRDPKLGERFLAQVVLGSLPAERSRHAGQTVAAAAAQYGQQPGEWALDLLVEAHLQVGAHLERPQLTAADLRQIVADHRHCAGSDGIYQGQHPHPRGHGAFARLAALYTNACGGTDFQQLVRHLSTNAADAHRLAQRGRLAPGKAADICVLAPTGLVERATDTQPREPAEGVALVLVNGVLVWPPATASPAHQPGKMITS
jgi:N-acyl-D-amino-acid deacylase